MDTREQRTIKVELCSLHDKRVSVRVDNEEICILPDRKECRIDDLQKAFQQVVDTIVADDDDQDPREW